MTTLIKFGALPLTVVSRLLALLSYGYLLGFLDVFRSSPEQLQLSALDYLQRSYRPIVVALHASEETATFGAFYAWIEGIWWKAWLLVPGLAVAASVFIYLAASDFQVASRVNRWKRYPESWNRAVRARLLAYSAPIVAPLALLVGAAGIGIAIWAAMTIFVVAVSFVPALAVGAGQSAANESVVEPLRCSQPI